MNYRHNPDAEINLVAKTFNKKNFDQMSHEEIKYAFESLLFMYKMKCYQLDLFVSGQREAA